MGAQLGIGHIALGRAVQLEHVLTERGEPFSHGFTGRPRGKQRMRDQAGKIRMASKQDQQTLDAERTCRLEIALELPRRAVQDLKEQPSLASKMVAYEPLSSSGSGGDHPCAGRLEAHLGKGA